MSIKKIISSMACVIAIATMTNSSVLASTFFSPSAFTSIELESDILPEGIEESIDYIKVPRRGVFFAAADLKIANNDGDIDVAGHAYMSEPVDEIYMIIYLDKLVINEDGEENWENIDEFEFEFYAEDYPDGELTSESVEFTLTGYPTGEYYRLRGAYAAVKDGLMEGFGPVTDGVLIQ